MNNIRVKQESLNNWRGEVTTEGLLSKLIKVGAGAYALKKGGEFLKKKGDAALDDARKNMKIGGDKRKTDIEKATGVKLEHIEGGISVQNVEDGLNFNEIETVDIIKPQPIKGASNWRLEMVTESLISEGYNDKEIVTIITEGSERDLGWASLLAGGIKNTLWAGRKVYDAGRGTRSIVNRAVKDSKLTKDIWDTAKKLRQPKLPQGVEVVKKGTERGGGIVKSFKGFMQNVKDAGSNLANRTKGKLDRINAKKAEIQTTAKDVDVLGGAASKTGSTSKLKNVTPKSVKATEVLKGVGDRVKDATDKIKVVGAGTVGATLGAATGLKDKVATGLKAPITNDGKKTIDPSKNEKIESQPTKRELRNKRNEYLSSKEGRRARRDSKIKNRPTGKTKWVGKNTTWKDRYGNVIAPKVG